MTLDELRRLAEAATKGTWRMAVDPNDNAHDVVSGSTWIASVDDGRGCKNGHYIAACSPDRVLAMLNALEAAQKACSAMLGDGPCYLRPAKGTPGESMWEMMEALAALRGVT